jgi:hypothetical protein
MLTFICASIALLSAVYAYLNHRRANELRAILAEGARKFQHQFEELGSLKKRLAAAADSHSVMEQDLLKLKQSQELENARNAKIVGELLNTQASMERKLGNAEAQRDHILGKFEALNDEREHLLSERSDTEQLIKTLESECDRLQQELERTNKKAAMNNSEDVQKLRQRLTLLEREIKDRTPTSDKSSSDLEAFRRKSLQNEQLYLSMKSLRDMTEERNKNWEIALRKLSTWILTSSHVAQPKDPVLMQSSIGPLVGEALERIGGTLLDQDDSGDISLENPENSHSAES